MLDDPERLGAAAAPPRGRGETVLVVEDSDAVRLLVMRQLRALGYEPVEASSAESGLAIVKERPVDLLFTDLLLPGGMNGVQLARAALELHPDMRVLLTSGYAGAVSDLAVAARNPVRLLAKPYAKIELARRLREALAA